MEKQRDLRRIFPSVLDRAFEIYKERRLVSDIMSRNVVTIEPDSMMDTAAKLMGAMRIGSLLVVEEAPIGIVSERDLLSDVIAKNRDPSKMKVSSVMSYPLVTIGPDATIKEAARTMIKGKTRLVVMREGVVLGIVTASDLVKSLPDAPETMLNLEEFMSKPVVMIDEGSTVLEASRIMGRKRIGSVITLRNGLPTGIFTERDLLTTVIAGGKELNALVGEYASSPILVSDPGISVHEAAYIMSTRRIKRLPLLDESNKLAGIVTARDLVEAYSK